MKKSVIGTIIVNCLFIIGALSSIYVGDGTSHDYAFLFIAIPAIMLDVGYLIYRQIKSKNKSKKSSEAEKHKDTNDTITK